MLQITLIVKTRPTDIIGGERVHAFVNDLERPVGADLYGRRIVR